MSRFVLYSASAVFWIYAGCEFTLRAFVILAWVEAAAAVFGAVTALAVSNDDAE